MSDQNNIFSFYNTQHAFFKRYPVLTLLFPIYCAKLCVNHQFIVPSLYNQITQLIFITDIFRPNCEDKMYNTFWRHALFVRGQSSSVKTFDRSRNGCQVIRLGRQAIFGGLPGRRSLSPHVSPSRAPVFSCVHYFQAPTTQAKI